MSNEIKKYDEYIFKDGEYRQVTGGDGASNLNGDNFVFTTNTDLKLKTSKPIKLLFTQKKTQQYHHVRVNVWTKKRGGHFLNIDLQSLKDDINQVYYEDLLKSVFGFSFTQMHSNEMQHDYWDANRFSLHRYKNNLYDSNPDAFSANVYICNLGSYEDFKSNYDIDSWKSAHPLIDIKDFYDEENDSWWFDQPGRAGMASYPTIIKFIKDPIIFSQGYRGKICRNALRISLTFVRPDNYRNNLYLFAYITPIYLE